MPAACTSRRGMLSIYCTHDNVMSFMKDNIFIKSDMDVDNMVVPTSTIAIIKIKPDAFFRAAFSSSATWQYW